ncbi:MAG: nitroreductase family protein [Candidatus Cryptobacteroides sp.]|nr:nitroreductase family protein [Bacteroidales bacterium]MDY6159044.1 nitroreductase family protein [Candidatus Cryptobacteroides sp.]
MKHYIYTILAAGLLVCSCGTPSGTKSDTKAENAVIEAIMSRRSIRVYKDTPVEREKLQRIAECGVNAPNAMNAQNWNVRIIDSKEYIDGVTEIYKAANPEAVQRDPNFKNMFRNAPAVIAVAAPQGGYSSIDCGLLGENIMLAAHSLGLGTCCLGGPVRFLSSNADAKPYLDRLKLDDGYELLYLIAVGYPDEAPEARPRNLDKIRFVE